MKLFGHSFVITSIQGKIILAGLGILNLFDKNMYHEYDYRNAFSLFSKYKVPFVDCCIASIPEVKQGMDYYFVILTSKTSRSMENSETDTKNCTFVASHI